MAPTPEEVVAAQAAATAPPTVPAEDRTDGSTAGQADDADDSGATSPSTSGRSRTRRTRRDSVAPDGVAGATSTDGAADDSAAPATTADDPAGSAGGDDQHDDAGDEAGSDGRRRRRGRRGGRGRGRGADATSDAESGTDDGTTVRTMTRRTAVATPTSTLLPMARPQTTATAPADSRTRRTRSRRSGGGRGNGAGDGAGDRPAAARTVTDRPQSPATTVMSSRPTRPTTMTRAAVPAAAGGGVVAVAAAGTAAARATPTTPARGRAPARAARPAAPPARARGSSDDADDGVRAIKGSTRLEAKRQRRRDGRDNTRRRPPILSESEFLSRRESVERIMVVRQRGDRTRIGVLEDGVLVEHYVTKASATSYAGNIYLGRVQNVLPSMEAAFIDIGKSRNAVLYAGEVNWDAAGLEGRSRSIEHAMRSGDPVLVQVTKDPVAHKGARLTSQISLPGRFLVYVPGGGTTGISRKLPDTERARLKAILKKIVPEDAGVIIRTAAEGASEEELTRDVERLTGAVGGHLRTGGQGEGQGSGPAARRTRPCHPGGPRRLQRGLQRAPRLR